MFNRSTICKVANKLRKDGYTLSQAFRMAWRLAKGTATVEEQKIDKDELTRIARSIDSIVYPVQAVVEEYFEKFNSADKEEHWSIAWEYNRNRTKMSAVSELVFLCTKELK